MASEIRQNLMLLLTSEMFVTFLEDKQIYEPTHQCIGKDIPT